MTSSLLASSLVLFGSLVAMARAAVVVTEDFSGPGLNPALEVTKSGAFTFGGTAVNIDNSRQYIRTVDADYLSVDFTFNVTYTVPINGGGAGIAFLGFGQGEGDPAFFGEPLLSLYMRNGPNDFESGFLQPSINSGGGSVNEMTRLGNPGGGTHRAQFTRVGDSLVFALDEDSSSGAFVADYSKTFSVSADLPFLTTSNSRLFVGSESSGVSFDQFNVTVSAVPEPYSAAMVGVLLLGLGIGWRRHNRGGHS